MLFRNENPILGPFTQITWLDGSLHYLAPGSDPAFSQANIVASVFENASAPVLNYQGSVNITGAVVAERGALTVAAGTTVASGFLYGAEGKLIVKGTLSTANFSAGLVGQLDLSTATLSSPGPIAAIWGDMGASMSASAISGEADLQVLLLTSTCPGSSINSAIKVETLSTYLLDLSDSSYASGYATSSTAGTQLGRIKIKLPSGDGYINVFAVS